MPRTHRSSLLLAAIIILAALTVACAPQGRRRDPDLPFPDAPALVLWFDDGVTIADSALRVDGRPLSAQVGMTTVHAATAQGDYRALTFNERVYVLVLRRTATHVTLRILPERDTATMRLMEAGALGSAADTVGSSLTVLLSDWEMLDVARGENGCRGQCAFGLYGYIQRQTLTGITPQLAHELALAEEQKAHPAEAAPVVHAAHNRGPSAGGALMGGLIAGPAGAILGAHAPGAP